MKNEQALFEYLDNHGINFVGGELEFVSRKRVSQTQSHGGSLGLLNASHFDQMLSDSSRQLVDGRRVDALQTDLLSDHRSKLESYFKTSFFYLSVLLYQQQRGSR